MWVIVHALTGMALGSLLPSDPVLLILAALGGHALLDLVPHWDYVGQRQRALWGTLDVSATTVVVLVGWLVLQLPARVLLCGVVSAIPDLDVLNALLPYRKRTRWFPSHWSGFPHGHAGPLPGIAVQVALVVLSAATIWRFA